MFDKQTGMTYEELSLLYLSYRMAWGKNYARPFARSLDRPAALEAKAALLTCGLLEFATPDTDWRVLLTEEGYVAAQVVCEPML